MAPALRLDACIAELAPPSSSGLLKCPSRRESLVMHRWSRQGGTAAAEPAGAVLIFHGLGSHGRFPSVRYLAEALLDDTSTEALGDVAVYPYLFIRHAVSEIC